MTPFGRTVQSAKGRKELHDEIIDHSHSTTELKDGRDPELDCSATQYVKSCQASNKSLARYVTENGDNDDDVYDDEYVPDESELKYSWYEDEDEEGPERVPTKVGKQTTRKHSLNVVYREEDSPKAKKKKRTNKSVRRTDCRPVDDGSEKVYRQRIRYILHVHIFRHSITKGNYSTIGIDWSHEIMTSEIQSVVAKLNVDYLWECSKLIVVTERCSVRCFKKWI